VSSFEDLIRMLETRERRQAEALELTRQQLSEARSAAASVPAKVK
jgi:hypothetical protein